MTGAATGPARHHGRKVCGIRGARRHRAHDRDEEGQARRQRCRDTRRVTGWRTSGGVAALPDGSPRSAWSDRRLLAVRGGRRGCGPPLRGVTRGHQSGDQLHGDTHGGRDVRGQLLAGVDLAGFDPDDGKALRHSLKGLTEGQRVGDAESVAPSRGRDGRRRQPLGPEVEGAWGGAGPGRVDHHRKVGVSPRVQQSRRLAVTPNDVNRIAEPSASSLRNRPSDAVVAPPGVSDPDHESGTGHVRSTVRSRKWVAHEMHGS